MKNRKDLFIFFALVIILFILNKLFFGLQLSYGFRDVDWEMLYYYKIFGELSFDHLLQAYRVMGAYTYQLYYVGFLEKILGLNFASLHQATQIFKVIAGLSIYLLIVVIFKRKLLAVLTSLIYTINYTHAGALFMLSTGGYFFASIFMSLFLIVYYYALIEKTVLRWIAASIFLILTLILNTERMYPLIPLVILTELVFIFFNKFKKDALNVSFRRTLIIFLPLIVFSFMYMVWFKTSIVNAGFAPGQFFVGVEMRISSILNGNWQLLLYPFASFGSMFLYGDWWKYLGQVNVSSLTSYLIFLIFGPILKLGILSAILLFFIFKRALKQILLTMIPVFIFGLIAYLMAINWTQINSQVRIHFDPNLVIVPALFGFYIIALSLVVFFYWIKDYKKELTPLIVGSAFSLLFIFSTWVASDIQLLFMGPQRYLSIPSIGTSLFISGILIIIFNRLKEVNLIKQFAWFTFLLLIPLVSINYQVAHEFFNYELIFAGMRGEEQTIMKNSFRDLTPNISRKERSLFYFDETADKDNGYFDESTVLAGFEFWTKFNGRGEFENFPEPGMMRTNVHQCPETTHQSCLKMLSEGLTVQNGEKGFLYKDIIRGQKEPRFYKLSNFYAMRFIDKDIVDIRKEVINGLNITP